MNLSIFSTDHRTHHKSAHEMRDVVVVDMQFLGYRENASDYENNGKKENGGEDAEPRKV